MRPVCLASSALRDVFKVPHVVAAASTSFFFMANILLCGYTTFGLFLRQITSSPPTPPYISHFPLYLPLPWSASFHSHPNFDTAPSFLRCAFHGL